MFLFLVLQNLASEGEDEDEDEEEGKFAVKDWSEVQCSQTVVSGLSQFLLKNKDFIRWAASLLKLQTSRK